MTTYRLRDRKLQQKLDEITNGGFSEQLEYGLVSKEYPAEIYCVSCDLYAGTKRGRIAIRLTGCEIETVQKYDPNAWNSYPEVAHPEGVLMRVELETSEGDVDRKCAIFENGNWWKVNESNGKASCIAIEIAGGKVKRFRTWE